MPFKKILFIGIDGCRPDALLEADIPVMRQLIETSVFSDQGLTCRHSNSASCWASLLTGVWEDEHGILDNNCENARIRQNPTLFQRILDFRHSAQTAAVVHWTTRHHPILEGVNYYRSVSNDAKVTQISKELLIEEGPDCLFVLLNGVDDAGHEHGFAPTSLGYLQAISMADQCIGELQQGLRERMRISPDEEWLLFITTDHGGLGKHHGGASFEERRTFAIASNLNQTEHKNLGSFEVIDVVPKLLQYLEKGWNQSFV